ncbi:hypothetical protein [Ohtaekwangia koreensis]|uniref:Fasciclin domain-containing protein n=1 Tax=Ohtaekwangia koreensis TaxID=688867 RepID=A0A1T5MCT3_9BACT|nr:hypothetical protein [Ohtaekwangia koreensis]SKC86057.1 hypothetical protein SAMN05660236_5047 [Ohtaekwangia koreensis]
MNKYIFGTLLLIAFISASCDYEYLTDGGVHDPKVDMTTYDYLNTHSWKVFDTLILLIDHNNMKDELNRAGTLLAVTDYSFKKYMLANWTLDSLKKHVTADTLRNYLFEQPILWADLSVEAKDYQSISGKELQFQLKEQTDGYYSEWTASPVYRLAINRVRESSTSAINYCQTSNVQTNTGVIHAMENMHVFNFGYH